MEDTSKMVCSHCSKKLKQGRDVNSKSSQTEYKSVMEIKDEEIPCAVDVRVTKRHGGVRLTLSNIKKIRKSATGVEFVRGPQVTHLTQDQLALLTDLAPRLQTALSKTSTKDTKTKDTPNKKRPRQTILLDRALPLKKRRYPRKTEKTKENPTCVLQQKAQGVTEGVESLKQSQPLSSNFIIPTVRRNVSPS